MQHGRPAHPQMNGAIRLVTGGVGKRGQSPLPPYLLSPPAADACSQPLKSSSQPFTKKTKKQEREREKERELIPALHKKKQKREEKKKKKKLK